MPKEHDEKRRSVRNDNDWRKITDAAERRRAQNRIAQRNYRRNIKLRQQELDQLHESFTPRSPASTQRQPARLQPAAMNTSTSSSVSSSLSESMPTAQQTSTSLDTFWEDMIGASSFSELAVDTEDFEALSLMPSTQESAVATQSRRQTDGSPHWIDIENYSSSFNAITTQPARSSESTPLNALQKAVFRGQNSVARLLTEHGADVHVVDRDQNNLLHLAVQSGSSALILFALRNGINVNETNALGHTALHLAIEREDLDAIRILLGAGADIEMKS